MKNEYQSCLYAIWKSRANLKEGINEYKHIRILRKLLAVLLSIITFSLLLFVESSGNYLSDILLNVMSKLPCPLSSDLYFMVVDKALFVSLPTYVSLIVKKYASGILERGNKK